MADIFRDNAFPRLIDRIIIRVEATLYIIGGILLMFFIGAESLDAQELRSPLRVAIEIITSSPAIAGLGVTALITGIVAWWATLDKMREKVLEHTVFAFFLIRLYAFIGTAITTDGWEDTRWMNHFSWVILWAAYWLIFRLRKEHE